MTQRGEGGAGEPAASGTPVPVPRDADSSAWAPLGQRAFRWLWLGVLVSWIGTWMQTVGAQWLVVDAPNAAALVSLVQAANTLPVMLLALPGGVLADSFDRRWLLITVQVYFFVVGTLLAVLTAVGQMPPALLLAFTFALGAAGAVQLPGWQAIIPELVPRTQLRAAARLDLVGVNLARSVGPALRAGGRYIWHEPVVRRILFRVMLFVIPAMALWALLPLIASQRLGLEADGYGALFGALGLGAIVGAVVLPLVRDRLSTNGTLGAAVVLYAAAQAGIVLAPNFPAALATLVLAGLSWMAVTSTLVSELQLFLPAWVRARGLAVFTVTFTGAMTAGALVWGLVAEGAGLLPTVLLAAVVVLAGAVAGLFWRVPETGHLDPQPAIYWADARLAYDPEPDTGPIVVIVYYTVTPQRQAAFLEAMVQLRRSRLRTGATRCELYPTFRS